MCERSLPEEVPKSCITLVYCASYAHLGALTAADRWRTPVGELHFAFSSLFGLITQSNVFTLSEYTLTLSFTQLGHTMSSTSKLVADPSHGFIGCLRIRRRVLTCGVYAAMSGPSAISHSSVVLPRYI